MSAMTGSATDSAIVPETVASAERVSGAGRGFGIDIGGSGIKGCPVDLVAGAFAADRLRTPTPSPSTPTAVAAVVADIVRAFGDAAGTGPVGVTFPAVIQRGVARTAANVDKSWIGADVQSLLQTTLGRPVRVVNDADATGTVFMATLGTGIGSALIVDGVLVPNTEFGHLEVDGKDAETRAADSARERDDLTWQQWAKRLTKYFQAIERLLWPDLIVVGGGVSKKADKFLPLLDIRTPIVASQLRNAGGSVGAARLP